MLDVLFWELKVGGGMSYMEALRYVICNFWSKNLKFFSYKFFQFLVISTLVLSPDLDPDPYWNQCVSETLSKCSEIEWSHQTDSKNYRYKSDCSFLLLVCLSLDLKQFENRTNFHNNIDGAFDLHLDFLLFSIFLRNSRLFLAWLLLGNPAKLDVNCTFS